MPPIAGPKRCLMRASSSFWSSCARDRELDDRDLFVGAEARSVLHRQAAQAAFEGGGEALPVMAPPQDLVHELEAGRIGPTLEQGDRFRRSTESVQRLRSKSETLSGQIIWQVLPVAGVQARQRGSRVRLAQLECRKQRAVTSRIRSRRKLLQQHLQQIACRFDQIQPREALGQPAAKIEPFIARRQQIWVAAVQSQRGDRRKRI
ncbi:MAG TPA: hypothetical protein VF031_00275 [Alphaproteobacteria bacterium]